MTARRSPNMTEQLAAALLQVEGCPDLYRDAKAMTAAQIVSLYQRDHYPVRVVDQAALAAAGIPYINHPCNITWRLIAAHRKKTAERDAPAIAKGNRIRKRVVRDSALAELRKFSPELDVALAGLSLIDSRSRIASRGFDTTKTRGFDGRVRPRKRMR